MNADKRPIYPIELWNVTETAYLPKNNYRNEPTFSLPAERGGLWHCRR